MDFGFGIGNFYVGGMGVYFIYLFVFKAWGDR